MGPRRHDMKYLMENMKARFTQSEVKCLLVQLLKACNYLHDARGLALSHHNPQWRG